MRRVILQRKLTMYPLFSFCATQCVPLYDHSKLQIVQRNERKSSREHSLQNQIKAGKICQNRKNALLSHQPAAAAEFEASPRFSKKYTIPSFLPSQQKTTVYKSTAVTLCWLG
ncbi:hypothetical protein ACTXT7_009276 [Hymenolepis weldensis]